MVLGEKEETPMDEEEPICKEGNSPLKPGKRRAPSYDDLLPKAKRAKTLQHNISRTPLSVLNELRKGLVFYLESKQGPQHDPNFEMAVKVDGIVYKGQAKCKQLAKQRAAEAALNAISPGLTSPVYSEDNIDFTKDDLIEHNESWLSYTSSVK